MSSYNLHLIENIGILAIIFYLNNWPVSKKFDRNVKKRGTDKM